VPELGADVEVLEKDLVEIGEPVVLRAAGVVVPRGAGRRRLREKPWTSVFLNSVKLTSPPITRL